MSRSPWITIDCQYQFPKFAASFLKVVDGFSVFIENNTAHAVPTLLNELKRHGGHPSQVDLIIVTHAHLDHAGGTSKLLEACPNAKVLAHPKTVKTLVDPSRLVIGARKVYGDNEFERLYGEVEPVPEEKICKVEDREKIEWRGNTLQFFYTLGHASHHLCVFEKESKSVFTGDAFGVCYPSLRGKRPFHFPSTSPVDFNFEEACYSIDQILESGAEKAYLTHFGEVVSLHKRAQELKTHLSFHQSLIESAEDGKIPDEKVLVFMERNIDEYFEKCLLEREISKSKENWELLNLDRKLNAAGLAYVLLKQRGKAK
jgi:glyoxylase-like metal-dependent hydrolase (beta-lactamase superfamily II)